MDADISKAIRTIQRGGKTAVREAIRRLLQDDLPGLRQSVAMLCSFPDIVGMQEFAACKWCYNEVETSPHTRNEIIHDEACIGNALLGLLDGLPADEPPTSAPPTPPINAPHMYDLDSHAWDDKINQKPEFFDL